MITNGFVLDWLLLFFAYLSAFSMSTYQCFPLRALIKLLLFSLYVWLLFKVMICFSCITKNVHCWIKEFLLQIGHKVVIGKNCMLCEQVGIVGSVTSVILILLHLLFQLTKLCLGLLSISAQVLLSLLNSRYNMIFLELETM